MDPTLGELVTGLERRAAGADASTLLGLLGDVERLKGVLWQRLVATAFQVDSKDHSAGDVDELRHLTPHHVGELLNVTPAYVHELCRTGRLPAKKSGKYWMISVTGLRRWLMSGNRDIDATVNERLQSLPPHANVGRARPSAPRRAAPTG